MRIQILILGFKGLISKTEVAFFQKRYMQVRKMRPCHGNILKTDMGTQQQCKTVEMVANDTKMGCNCDSNKEKHKYNSKILTATRCESI